MAGLSPSTQQQQGSQKYSSRIPPPAALLSEFLLTRAKLQEVVNRLQTPRIRAYLPNSSALIFGRRTLSETQTASEDLAQMVAEEKAQHVKPPSFSSLFDQKIETADEHEGENNDSEKQRIEEEESAIEASLDRLIEEMTRSNERNATLLQQRRDEFQNQGIREINQWAIATSVQAPPETAISSTSTNAAMSSTAQWALNQERQLELESQIKKLEKDVDAAEKRAINKRSIVDGYLTDVSTVEKAISQLHQDQEVRINEIEAMRLDALKDLRSSYDEKLAPSLKELESREEVLAAEEEQIAQLEIDLEKQYQDQAKSSGLDDLREKVAAIEAKLKATSEQ